MEEIEEHIPAGYLEAFNTGYTFSIAFPEVSENIVSQNQSSQELDPISGLFGGINQGLIEGREIAKDRLTELKQISDSRFKDDFEIDR